jgi:hypothetical protein
MRYLFLLRPDDGPGRELTGDERTQLFAKFVAWTESLKARGHLAVVERLGDHDGTTVRKKRDVVVVDGPYAEARELVSGLFVVEVTSRDDAHRLAGECPLLGIGGSIEVRQIVDFPIKP